MRALLIAAAVLFSPSALAQTPPHIAGFHIGMTIQEAHAHAPHVIQPYQVNLQRLHVTQRTHRIGALDIPLQLIFVDGELDFAGGEETFSVPSSLACAERLQEVVTALEASVGVLDDAENNADVLGALPSVATDGGSVIRISERDGVTSAVAVANEPTYAEVRAYSFADVDGWRCTLTFEISNQAPPPADLPRATLQSIPWTERASGQDFARFFPVRALEHSRPGSVMLICTVLPEGALDCAVGYEGPQGWGFGEAALRIAQRFKVAPQTEDGAATAGQTVRVPIRFRVAF
ncbi:MAG TPA: TonB family protein [Vitreimonas sp.]|uniref:TonB family protein n=1 Tax=Vitreimonas sp. TaxID=3069702 RepID=UPI002D4BFB2B|nr:TonB family protein [Vitreimonas sp.]HYD87677.1 TonB family protein [Vitreimonas sp.]